MNAHARFSSHARFFVAAPGGSRVRLTVAGPTAAVVIAGLARAAHALGATGWQISVDLDTVTPEGAARRSSAPTGYSSCLELVACPRSVDRHGQITAANVEAVAAAARELLGGGVG
jgi:hypothetical protein